MKKSRENDPLSELYTSFDEEVKRINEANAPILRELDEACKKDFEPILDALKEW